MQVFTPGSGVGLGECRGVACVDLNRDGAYDVIVASNQGVNYYRNDGTASFTLTKLSSVPANAVVAGDLLNNDGYIDIFVATSDVDSILVNSGDNVNFNSISLVLSDTSRAAALVDFDLDGDLDIFVAGGQSRLYRNDQDSFPPVQTFPQGFACSWADYNSDGHPDLALAAEDRVIIYTGPGFVLDTVIMGQAPRGLCWFDCDTNGLLDIAVADSAGVNFLLRNTESGFVKQDIGTTAATSIAVAAGNFWVQPGVDLLFINHGEGDHLYRGSQTGDFSAEPEETISFGGNDSGRAVALADLDGQNGLDASVVGSPANAIYTSDVIEDNKVIVGLVGRRDVLGSLSNTMAAGALLKLYEGSDLRAFWEITAGSGHAGQDAAQKIIPLTSTENHLLEISWPRSGVIDSIPLDTFTTSPPITVDAYEDITSPQPPDSLTSTSHDTTNWSSDRNVSFKWKPGIDLHGSGLAGYSVLWDTSLTATPDASMEKSDTATGGTFSAVCEDSTCYFLMSSVDKVGNISTPTYIGPFKLDFTPPAGIEEVRPADSSFINDDETWVQYRWTKGEDELSGISTYHIDVSKDPYFIAQDVDEFTVPSDSNSYRSSEAIGEGEFFWRIITTDAAGNKDTLPDSPQPGLLFTVDITPPYVTQVNPPDGAEGVALNPIIYIAFNEDMDTSTTLTTSSYDIQQNSVSREFIVDYFDTTSKSPHAYVLDLAEDLQPNTKVYVTIRDEVADLAGNNMFKDTTIIFTTGDRKDTVGPVIDSVSIVPNPTYGKDTVAIMTWVTDTAECSAGPFKCLFFINDSIGPLSMKLADGFADSTAEEFTLKLPTDTVGAGYHELRFRAQDRATPGNSGPWFTTYLSVTPDTVSPKIEVDILNDTIDAKIKVGDSLRLKIKTSSPLSSLRLEFYHEGSSVFDTFVPPPKDSTLVGIYLVGFPTGSIRGTATGIGQDTTLTPGNAFFDFTIEASELLSAAMVFASPNPASDEVIIYFTSGEDVTANLRVFTIDAHQVWKPDEIEVEGGIRSEEFRIDVSNWPVGLYLFVLQVTNEEGRRAVIKKIFAVIR